MQQNLILEIISSLPKVFVEKLFGLFVGVLDVAIAVVIVVEYIFKGNDNIN